MSLSLWGWKLLICQCSTFFHLLKKQNDQFCLNLFKKRNHIDRPASGLWESFWYESYIEQKKQIQLNFIGPLPLNTLEKRCLSQEMITNMALTSMISEMAPLAPVQAKITQVWILWQDEARNTAQVCCFPCTPLRGLGKLIQVH